jgi:hypothetical protein
LEAIVSKERAGTGEIGRVEQGLSIDKQKGHRLRQEAWERGK